jgi:hypothetical protein
MENWRDLMRQKRFSEAEKVITEEFSRLEHIGDSILSRGYFYETWASNVERQNPQQALVYYHKALNDYSVYASWATSGGEGTARMVDVDRLDKKIQKLEAAVKKKAAP